MGIVMYSNPIDERLADEDFMDYFNSVYYAENPDAETMLDDDGYEEAIRDQEHVSRVWEAYNNKIKNNQEST